ncbi:Protein of unknown function [Desulfatibacillum alkenivorans DSM 16219]|uniref:DUF429 domain-containing protein n=2 Tax=Desulfatibacillum alkenivorans TaxID=259354 RepID=A0A1M6K025_9BACT|nr:Protein of unknown function [Desulfatibacillum alkenivorans DSM 16219]
MQGPFFVPESIMKTCIIGIDCATSHTRTGVAYGECKGADVRIRHVEVGNSNMVKDMASAIAKADRVFLAMDAPLGWPALLAEGLADHQAGDPLPGKANDLFRRHTDRFCWKAIGKLPLDVGADRIARTAHAALAILAELRELTGEPIPLAWSPDYEEKACAGEIYPAAVLIKYGLPSSGYKDDKSQKCLDIRKQILDGVIPLLKGAENMELLHKNADALDAALCILGGRNFLMGDVCFPDNEKLARKEGWIWI